MVFRAVSFFSRALFSPKSRPFMDDVIVQLQSQEFWACLIRLA